MLLINKYVSITLEINKFRVWRKMITIYICIYRCICFFVWIYRRAKVFSSMRTFKWHHNNCMHLLLLLTKLEMQMPYKVVHMLIQKNFIFFISLWGITLSKIIGSFKSFKRGNWKFLNFNGHNNSILSISLINIRQSLMTVSFSLLKYQQALVNE